jgi:hypothetical protein
MSETGSPFELTDTTSQQAHEKEARAMAELGRASLGPLFQLIAYSRFLDENISFKDTKLTKRFLRVFWGKDKSLRVEDLTRAIKVFDSLPASDPTPEELEASRILERIDQDLPALEERVERLMHQYGL